VCIILCCGIYNIIMSSTANTSLLRNNINNELSSPLLPFSEDDERERRTLSLIQKCKKSNYGSLHQDTQKQQTTNAFIVNYRHKLKSGETLQGISLKYGVAIDQIKRVNRLWSNDLAIVKDVLLIPIDREKLKDMNLQHTDPDNTNIEDNNYDNSKVSMSNLKSQKTFDNNNETTAKQSTENESVNNFLNRFDSFINESKEKLKHLETNTK
jgi:LysM repeat protein